MENTCIKHRTRYNHTMAVNGTAPGGTCDECWRFFQSVQADKARAEVAERAQLRK